MRRNGLRGEQASTRGISLSGDCPEGHWLSIVGAGPAVGNLIVMDTAAFVVFADEYRAPARFSPQAALAARQRRCPFRYRGVATPRSNGARIAASIMMPDGCRVDRRSIEGRGPTIVMRGRG